MRRDAANYLHETDACLLARSCAVTCKEHVERTTDKVIADLDGALFSLVMAARPALSDAMFESVRVAQKLILEDQARGSLHIHICIWVAEADGREAPGWNTRSCEHSGCSFFVRLSMI